MSNLDFALTPLLRDRAVSVNQWVYLSLRNALMCGQIAPGLPLTIRGLAEKLAVSPMPVREALQRLTCEGALLVKDNRRVIVPEMTAQKFKALYELRVVLEPHAGGGALPYVRSEHISELERLDDLVDQALNVGDVEQITLTNQQFHRYLYRINPDYSIIMPLIESVWLQLGPFLRAISEHLQESYKIDRHKEAIAALRQHNAFALRRAVEADIRDGLAGLEAQGGLDHYFMR